MVGTITKSTGSWYAILGEDENIYQGRLRGKFKIMELKVTNPLAVGDIVDFEPEEGRETVAIVNIHPRENYIIRKSTHKTSQGHLIAANLDQAVLIVTLTFPRTSLGFIDRFLVTAESFRIPSVLVFNKIDLLNEKGLSIQEELCALYESLNYKCLKVSVIQNKGLESVKEQLMGKVSLLSGHSGVGKSSLMNKIDPSLDLKTGKVSAFAEKGIHTTTFAEMHRLNKDTYVIDTPGIKELGMVDMGKQEISHYFPEMRALLGQCKFHNCLHVNEPGCAVKAKLEEGEIAASRFDSYLSILYEQDTHR